MYRSQRVISGLEGVVVINMKKAKAILRIPLSHTHTHKQTYTHRTNSVLNGERLNVISLKSGKRESCLLSSHLFNVVLEILTRVIMQEKTGHKDPNNHRSNKMK